MEKPHPCESPTTWVAAREFNGEQAMSSMESSKTALRLPLPMAIVFERERQRERASDERSIGCWSCLENSLLPVSDLYKFRVERRARLVYKESITRQKANNAAL
ncbi:hypothetical protein MUK42_27808 [Musa troglodytarum]|uniref:Uncharacterized protein n=1 Tax=Musa troglodytarum TaxID=320322 RepID=A0A9E7JWW6_9LILI|nr:hypothetical protein MUK42_27808 [Musa troglodytarum]